VKCGVHANQVRSILDATKIVLIDRLQITGFWEMFNAFNTDTVTDYAGSLVSSSFGQTARRA
jgi:hypothetical protein